VADTKISALTAASAVADANEFAINEAGTSKKVTALQLRTYVGDTLITGNSGALDPDSAPSQTRQILTANNSDIPTTTVVTQLTATGCGTGWWLVEYFILWQSNVTTTGITFIVDHTGTAANSQWTREDMVGGLATASNGVSSQGIATATTGFCTSNWGVRADNSALGPNAGVDVINVNQMTRITGQLLVTGTGDLLLRANSEVASTITRVCAGTTARYTRLS
jgi:hypothetical protein